MSKILGDIYRLFPEDLRKHGERIKSSNIGQRMMKGAFWSLAGSVVSRALMLVASILVARILGQSQYGELGIIRSTVNMFIVFAGFGLGMTATKYIAELKDQDKERTGKIIGLSTLFAGIMGSIVTTIIYFLAPFLAEKTLNAPHLIFELRIGAFMLFFGAMNGAQTGILAGFEAFKSIAKINFTAGLMAFPIQVGFTLMFGLYGSIIGFGTNFLLLWILGIFAVRKETEKREIIINYQDSHEERDILIKFSFPALLSGLLVTPVMWISNALLVRQPNGFDEMAIFDAANQWRIIILFIPGLLSKIVLPLLSDPKVTTLNFKKIIKINILVNVVISFVIALGILFFSSTIMGAYGEGFSEGSEVVVVLAFSAIFISANNVIGQVLASQGRMWNGFLFNLLWGIVLIISAYFFLINGFGAFGLALSFLLAYFFHSIIQSLYISKSKLWVR